MSEKLRKRYNALARAAKPDDFLGQVRRTLGGKPIGEEQFNMILRAIEEGLDLRGGDVLLDLGCGNGLISHSIFERCAGGTGVDISDELVRIAKRNFENAPGRQYLCSDIVTYTAKAGDPAAYSKALCYGVFNHLNDAAAHELLLNLRARFTSLLRFFIGSLPDRDRLHDFFYPDAYVPGIEDDPESTLGLWRSQRDVEELAAAAGWTTSFSTMPRTFYASHYRFDAILEPQR